MERVEITPWFYYDVYQTAKRTIHSPSSELKRVQRLILRKYIKLHFKIKSVKDVASIHCGKKWLMKLDIFDFYNSITEKQIRDVINRCTERSIAPQTEGRSREVSDTEQIFSICTINGKLPTGAPTSPYIANMVLSDFDNNMLEVCRKFEVNYSRYMDDLFFSTDCEQYFLSFIELEVLKQLKELGLSINVDKIKYISSNKRQQVLGLGVNNEKPVLTKEDKRKYRAYFYNYIYPLRYNKTRRYKNHEEEILGHLAYIKSVDYEYYGRIRSYIFKLLRKWKLGNKSCLSNLIRINLL